MCYFKGLPTIPQNLLNLSYLYNIYKITRYLLALKVNSQNLLGYEILEHKEKVSV